MPISSRKSRLQGGFFVERAAKVDRHCTGTISDPESAFHIAKFAPEFPDAAFPFSEKAFRIAKFIA
ncbi:hypothetical protein [Ralstonia soli]|uniref:Uncharacterized protein n=1 Tax=Ralstonia soli TaxID=2953896 RepID=A0ABT1AQQ6_9RALS|nr:hypothetical protein [Ralstonia soli]MCO5400631.1 hypothetical protein [Ralstonia soli]